MVDGEPASAASDVFALGATLSAAVAGLDAGQTEALGPVLDALLRPHPADRPTATEAKQLLESVGGVTAPPPVAAAERPLWRLPLISAGALAVVALLVFLLLSIESRAEQGDGHCESRIPLSDGNRVRLDAHNQGERLADPCEMVMAVSEATLAKLRSAPIPARTTPFHERSLATVDACRALGGQDLAVVFPNGVPEPELGNRTCSWSVRGREYDEGQREWVEMATVTLSTGTPIGLCDKTRVLAAALGTRIPR
ncbi:hypothetical protein ACOBQX_09250 [Actinokineospora sp. G85]|uniref:hypothetical protein n=1 Tax=Actinokineospora sp. G85 TaxID=3406626 RepID=UPI003C70FF22